MAPFNVPKLGTEFELANDWTFDLYNDINNDTLMKYLGDTRERDYSFYYSGGGNAAPAVLPVGTALVIESFDFKKSREHHQHVVYLKTKTLRVIGKYSKRIRDVQPNGDTLFGAYIPSERKVPIKFWVTLDDFNKIVPQEIQPKKPTIVR